MSLDQFRLGEPLGIGTDGTRLAAVAAEGRAVEVTLLTGAVADADRWTSLKKRLRLAAMMQHSCACRVLELNLHADPPYVVTEPMAGGCIARRFSDCRPLSSPQTAQIVANLASLLVEAHRFGLAHGNLTPVTIAWTAQDQLRVDFCGTNVVATTPNIEFAKFFSAPEERTDSADPAVDLYSLGSLIYWLRGQHPNGNAGSTIEMPNSRTLPAATLSPDDFLLHEELCSLAAQLRSEEPASRPQASLVCAKLAPILARRGAGANVQSTMVDPDKMAAIIRDASPPQQLGRFRLLDKLGEGGMGAVYRAEDITDGSIVAVKLLCADTAGRPQALQRFRKEARMLAAVRSPFVANLLEINEQDGLHYLVQEFVPGRSLRNLLDERRILAEPLALEIIADVCRALVAAHANGVIHRDIKPDNVLLQETGPDQFAVKVADFGLARQIEQSQSLELTRESVVGTPLYMAPEQGRGTGEVDGRTDIYSTGATLFHLLAGRPPFIADSPLAVLLKHVNEPLPALKSFNSAVSDAACSIVEQAMAKTADERFPTAVAMLREIERIRRGEPANLTIHPLLPTADPRRIVEYAFTWELQAEPHELWPHVSNTERLNRAIGLPAVQFTSRLDGSRVRRFGKIRKLGITSTWEEHPFEWVEGRRFGVLREVQNGPLAWLASIVELANRPGGGTVLTHRFRILPRGWLGRVVAALEVGFNARRNLDRVYRRIDAHLVQRPSAISDPFEPGATMQGARSRRLEQGLDRILERGVLPQVVEQLGAYLGRASDQSVSRIRPLAVAEQLGLDHEQFVNACLFAANEGLLILMWDVLCPVCRIPSQIIDTLRAVREHGRCEACNLDYQLDFANSVELIFRVHPQIRKNEPGTFCIGGPAHSPHVAAQVRIAARESFELSLNLGEGMYRLRGPQLPYVVEFRVDAAARVDRWELRLSRRPGWDLPRALAARRQQFALINDTAGELLIRVERIAPRADALTAARAAALPLFRELFPGERLAPGQLISVAQVTLLATELADAGRLFLELGDAQTFARLHDHFRWLEDSARREGGVVVKTLAAGAMLAFHEPVAAVRTAIDLVGAIGKQAPDLAPAFRTAVHRGPALAATINDRIDYFGGTVSTAFELLDHSGTSEVVLSSVVMADPQVTDFLSHRSAASSVSAVSLTSGNHIVHRIDVTRVMP